MEPGPLNEAPSAVRLRERVAHYLRYTRGVAVADACQADLLAALELAVREVLIDRLEATRAAWSSSGAKSVCYLSMEFLLGPLLRNNLIATGLLDAARQALAGMGADLDGLLDSEVDAGLGNGGLGRLAACFLDSLATLDYPAWGYGLRYDYGIFRQEIVDGWQRERPDTWLDGGYAWEIPRPDLSVEVPLGGTLEWQRAEDGRQKPVWRTGHHLFGVPHDVLVAGHGTDSVAVLRLWKAEAPDEFDFDTFSRGDFLGAVAPRERAEAVTKVLYPSDAVEAGRRLRLMQEYFLSACAVRDITRRFVEENGPAWHRLPESVAVQLNDTHPALTVAELIRTLVDDAGVSWEMALRITQRTCAYTNHTLRPEALETWPIGLMQQLVPRHAQILFDLNQRFLEDVARRWPGDLDRMRRMSLVAEDGDQRFRMAHVAVVGSHRVNGVSQLHTELLTRHVLHDFAEMWPERFLSITNGITPRRWLAACNPPLAQLITGRLGDGWQRNLDRLGALAPLADDPDVQDEFLAAKRAAKLALVPVLRDLCGVAVDPDSLFDVQVKRMHEYKRQLLLALHLIATYRRIKADPSAPVTPRTVIVAGKAAPAYHMAKLVIRLISGIADVVNHDADVAGRLRVLFVPDYRVSLAEKIIPAADLSEQISTAGTEASGTGNMKLALNGAITIGTLDGANVEIRAAVGEDNIFIFGVTAAEAERLLIPGVYDPRTILAADAELGAAVEDLRRGRFTPGAAGAAQDLSANLVEGGDHFLNLVDFRSYAEAHQRAAALFIDRRAWAAAALRNIAAMGRFSADRAIREYAEQVWDIAPVDVTHGPADFRKVRG